MAVCPKCNYKLKMTNIAPNCPKCGTNLMFYGFEERFYREAKFAEMDIAAFRVWVAKVKAAFLGGKLQIARLCAVLLPIASLLVPLGTVDISLPLFDEKIQISGLGAYSLISKGALMTLLDFRQSQLFGELASKFILAFALFAVTALITVGILITQLLCFTNIKRTNVALVVLSALGLVTSAVSYILTLRIPDYGQIVSSSPSILGLLSQLASLAVVLALNAVLLKKGIEVKYREGDLYRVEMLKKYKRKEITLDDLPLPVFETEEERAERERKIEETEKKLAFAEAGGLKDE
jgi:hypothetical protein